LIDADEDQYEFYITIPADAVVGVSDALYITVETYYIEIIPKTCTTGTWDLYGYH